MKQTFFLHLTMLCTLALTAADTTDLEIRKYVDANRTNPKALNELLVDMGNWKTPDLTLAQELLTLGASADARDRGNIMEDNPGSAALTSAANLAHIDFVKFLLDNGANIETKCPWNGFTSVMYASKRCYNFEEHEAKESVDTLKLLIERKANVNMRTSCMPTTALILASEHAQVEKVKLLLAAGADITAVDERGKTALDRAKEKTFSQYRTDYDKVIALLKAAEQQQNA